MNWDLYFTIYVSCLFTFWLLYLSISELWTLGWSPMIDLDTLSFPSIPMDYLQDHDILEIYLKRLLLLGWRSRKQFEESWMALLGVFSLSKDDLSDAEVAALAQVSTLSVSAITGKNGIIGAQSFNSMQADLCQDMNKGFAFSRCLNGIFSLKEVLH